jgi:hypothetical protein
MNVEIGTEAAQFPEREYINGIFVAVCLQMYVNITLQKGTDNPTEFVCCTFLRNEGEGALIYEKDFTL